MLAVEVFLRRSERIEFKTGIPKRNLRVTTYDYCKTESSSWVHHSCRIMNGGATLKVYEETGRPTRPPEELEHLLPRPKNRLLNWIQDEGDRNESLFLNYNMTIQFQFAVRLSCTPSLNSPASDSFRGIECHYLHDKNNHKHGADSRNASQFIIKSRGLQRLVGSGQQRVH